MEKIELKANKREELGKKIKKLRKQGLIPAVVYGRKFKSTPIAIERKSFQKKVLESDAGTNLIFTIKLTDAGKAQSIPVISHGIQRNPLTDEIIHLDLMHVIMDEIIKAKVPVELKGVPIGVKEEGGVLVHGIREIEVKCLPSDIPDKFVLDVTGLKINDSLQVSDLTVSKKIEIQVESTEMVANVSPPTKEEEVAPPPPTPEELAAAEAAGVEGVEGVPGELPKEGSKEKAAPGAATGTPAAKEKPAAAGKKDK